MKTDAYNTIKDALKDTPEQTICIKNHGTQEQHILHPQQFTLQPAGKGHIDIFPLYEGIELSFHRYLAASVHAHHIPQPHILEINYCRQGRIGWSMGKDTNVYLGSSDLCIHSLACCADSKMTLPLGYYEGIAITIDLQSYQTKHLPIIAETAVNLDQLYERYCGPDKKPIRFSHPWIQSVFSQMFTSPLTSSLPYFQLKCIELLFYLIEIEEQAPALSCSREQSEQIRAIHQFLIEHIDQRFTIEELAKRYLMNTSSLKTAFKAVYGMPIAAYMKEYRLQLAAQLLKESEMSINEIAEYIGYESQGKFTKAFKARMQRLPTQYRKERH